MKSISYNAFGTTMVLTDYIPRRFSWPFEDFYKKIRE